MENERKILLLSGLGTLDDHLAAAAIALRRFPGAQLEFASMGVLPEVLRPFAGEGYDEVHLLGIGLGEADPEQLGAVFGALVSGGATLVWHSVGVPVPPELPPEVRALFTPRVGNEGSLAERLAKELGVGNATFILSLLGERSRSGMAADWRRRLDAASWSFSNTHDWGMLRTTAKDLAEGVAPERWGEPTKRLLENYRSFGSRELQASGPRMRPLRKEIGLVAASGVRRVLVTGESGVGKETVAQQLHVQSGRRGPYLAFNCATVARDLVESRLFGHVRGAFTGATSDEPGLFRAANGGTLFLDEIAELSLDVQGVLLRVLQDGVVLPMGGTEETPVNVLVVAATNRDLTELVREGRFREDLYWRLSLVELHVPPLRDRKADFPQIVRSEWRKKAPGRKPLAKEEIDALRAYDWPGNVRELGNVLERAAIFPDRPLAELVEEERARAVRLVAAPAAGVPAAAPAAVPAVAPPAPAAAPAAVAAAAPAAPPPPPVLAASAADDPENLEEAVRAHMLRVYHRYGDNLTAAARALGVTRNTLRERVKGALAAGR